MSENKATLYAKMAQVMGKLERIKETGKHEKQHWTYATSEDVKDAVRGAMSEAGLALLVNLEEYEITNLEGKGVLVRGKMAFTLCCSETGETVTCYLWGEAADQQFVSDKAFYKLYTTCEKYFLKTVFLISSGDDLDSDGDDTSRVQPGVATSRPPQNGRAKKDTAPLDTFLARTRVELNLSEEHTKAILKELGHKGFAPDKADDYFTELQSQLEESSTTETAMLVVVNEVTGGYYKNVYHLRNAMKNIDPGFVYPPDIGDHSQWQICASLAIEHANAGGDEAEAEAEGEGRDIDEALGLSAADPRP